ncbi:MAG: hypothetical protein C0606_13315 [Hyphomicrobiales bacterium]|nr:MAG: hypothetical protein C0606_13315 [Hyphomicrobiales bacterium]
MTCCLSVEALLPVELFTAKLASLFLPFDTYEPAIVAAFAPVDGYAGLCGLAVFAGAIPDLSAAQPVLAATISAGAIGWDSGWYWGLGFVVGLTVGLAALWATARRLGRLSNRVRALEQHLAAVGGPLATGGRTGAAEHDRLEERLDRISAALDDWTAQYGRKNDLRRRLISQLSHELRSPLASAYGYLETLQMKREQMTQEQRCEYVNIALLQVRSVEKIVSNMFQLAALEAGDVALQREAFAIDELINDIAQKHLAHADRHGTSIYLATMPQMPFVAGDVGATERIFDHILDNALQFSSSGDRVTIRAAAKDGFAMVSVVNEGARIPSSDLPHLFESFFTTHSSSGHQCHAGLGLAIARHLVELQGGRISAENLNDLKGVAFHFTLPLYGDDADG